jgi:hypothetical protein
MRLPKAPIPALAGGHIERRNDRRIPAGTLSCSQGLTLLPF